MTAWAWLLGLGLMFGLSLVLTLSLDYKMNGFFGFLIIFCSYMVWFEFLPLWVLVVCYLILVLLMIVKLKGKGGSG